METNLLVCNVSAPIRNPRRYLMGRLRINIFQNRKILIAALTDRYTNHEFSPEILPVFAPRINHNFENTRLLNL